MDKKLQISKQKNNVLLSTLNFKKFLLLLKSWKMQQNFKQILSLSRRSRKFLNKSKFCSLVTL